MFTNIKAMRNPPDSILCCFNAIQTILVKNNKAENFTWKYHFNSMSNHQKFYDNLEFLNPYEHFKDLDETWLRDI